MTFFDQVEHALSDPLLSRIGLILVVVIVVSVVVRALQAVIGRQVADQSVRYRMRKLLAFLGYAIGAIVIVASFSDNWGQVTVLFGVAGAGIAFALQEVIVSIAGWATLSFGVFYRPGDRVKLGGIVGDVIDIGVLRTTLMETGDWVSGDLYNGRVVRVANSFVFKEPVFNYSADFPFLWDEIKLPIRYGSDWRTAEKILTEAAQAVSGGLVEKSETRWERFVEKYLIERARVAPLVTMVVTGDFIEFTVRYITDYKSRRTSKDALSREILAGLEQHHDTIVLGATTIELLGLSEKSMREMRS
ncbi:MAG: mechanosensitive ion channel [Rhodospirillales bacterium]|nr:mechanosensitive ion channel [Rhodospirillales bacterium]